jgi:hypothetical protein
MERKVRKYIVLTAGVAITSGLVYQAYNSDAIGQTRLYFRRLRHALQCYIDALADNGEICSDLMRDLDKFLHSDDDEIPPTLRQVAKLLQAPAVTSATAATVHALYNGLYKTSDHNHGNSQDLATRSTTQKPAALDKILDAVLSERGHTLVSVAVSMAARNAVTAYCEASNQQQHDPSISNHKTSTDKILDFLGSISGQQLAVASMATLATEGVRVYMDRTLDINFYEDLFASMAKREHLSAVKECVGVFAKEAVSALLSSKDGDGNKGEVEEGSGLELIEQHHNNNNNGNWEEELRNKEGYRGQSVDSSSSCGVSTPIAAAEHAAGNKLNTNGYNSGAAAVTRRVTKTNNTGSTNNQWIAAVGRECIEVSKDPNGRRLMVEMAGATVREVTGAVFGTNQPRGDHDINHQPLVDQKTVMLAVLLLGFFISWLMQLLLNSVLGTR